MSASLLFALAAFVLAESPHPTPKSASIVVVASPFDSFLIQTGNVKITFRDGHSEFWTHSGDCHNAKVSTTGEVGWIRMDKKSVDVRRMALAGKDSLVVRLLDGAKSRSSRHKTRMLVSWTGDSRTTAKPLLFALWDITVLRHTRNMRLGLAEL